MLMRWRIQMAWSHFGLDLKRNYYGTYIHMSRKHVHRYVIVFACQHNERGLDTMALLSQLARRTVRCRLLFKELIA